MMTAFLLTWGGIIAIIIGIAPVFARLGGTTAPRDEHFLIAWMVLAAAAFTIPPAIYLCTQTL